MRRFRHVVLAVLLAGGCAHLGPSSGGDEREALWIQAHEALTAEQFPRATSLFDRLVEQYPGTPTARESMFYLGSMRLDPRNPAWDPEPAESTLRAYLTGDSTTRIQRRPEAETLLYLAQQLNMPADQRLPGLQPETKVVVREVPRVVTTARESRALAAEVERLRRELADRDAKLTQLTEELERIRKTLTGKK